MKKKSFLLTLFTAVIAVIMTIFVTLTVSAYEETKTVSDTPVQQTAAYSDYYDHYDDYYENNGTYRNEINWFRAIGTSLLVSVIGSGIAVAVVFSRYKFNGKTEPYPYNRKAPLELTGTEDVLIDRQIIRERIERDRR